MAQAQKSIISKTKMKFEPEPFYISKCVAQTPVKPILSLIHVEKL
jgi:hypothetical protein